MTMAAPILFTHTSSDVSPVITSIAFNPTLVSILQPRFMPIQKVNIAESGHPWVYELSTNVELELPVEFLDLPTNDITSPITTAGYNTLFTFLSSTTRWSRDAFVVTTVNNDSYTVRYIRGFESFREASGRTQRGDRWTGVLTLWRLP